MFLVRVGKDTKYVGALGPILFGAHLGSIFSIRGPFGTHFNQGHIALLALFALLALLAHLSIWPYWPYGPYGPYGP